MIGKWLVLLKHEGATVNLLAKIKDSIVLLSEAASFFPDSLAHFALGVRVRSFPVLEAVSPHAVENSAVRPGEDSVALLLIIHERSFILATVAVDKEAIAMHLVIHKHTSVATTVWPRVLASSFHFIVRKFTFVTRLIEHDEFSVSVAVPVAILALKSTVMPFFFALAMLLVIEPFTLIDSLICADQLALALSHMVFPLTDIEATICIKHAALSAEFVMNPVAIVSHSVGPDLAAFTVTLLSMPFSKVKSVVFHLLFFALLHRLSSIF